ncbi:hypothetical protein [Celerinatantimonas diazotrophica]|uniref:hypothetical protein n=1 Tax=Celerinatantimonas diazotrophica TaxID=412034 RepID=UPI0010532410|nr:hypothetical protein [Celerinatantimonas diazotrophica]
MFKLYLLATASGWGDSLVRVLELGHGAFAINTDAIQIAITLNNFNVTEIERVSGVRLPISTAIFE